MQTLLDDQIRDFYHANIEPFWNEYVQTGKLTAADGIEIAFAYALHPQAKGSISISSGRIESLVKYKELVFEFYQSGYSVFIHDHRGQGLSGRMLENPQHGYVESFDDYVNDFKQFYDEIIAPNSTHKPRLLCHSMGGAIGALYVLRHPDDFASVAFSAPMFGIQPVLPNWVGKALVGIHSLVKGTKNYFFGQQDYEADAFEDNILTHSEPRYALFRKEYDNQPVTYLGGITGGWLNAAIDAMNTIRQQAGNISIPILIMHAGDDKIVDNGAQAAVAAMIPNCTVLDVPGAFHELLMESNEHRTKVMQSIERFWQSH